MIAVETVLKKLITEYEFVIIPGLGALLSHHIPAFYDKTSGYFAPPAKKLAFNEYLKLDDGLLANYISRHEKVSHSEAVDYVKAYTERLKSELESTGNAIIAEIGDFSKNVEGKLIFEPKSDKYFKDEWYGFEKIKAKQFAKSALSKPLQTVSFEAEEEVEVLEYQDDKVRSIKWGRWVAAAVLVLLCGLSVFLLNTDNTEIRSTLNPFTAMFSKGNGEVATEVVQDEPVVEVVEPADSEVSADANAATEILPETDSSNTIATAEPAAPITPVAPKTDAIKFYVIAGAFNGPRQAHVLLEELKEKGFESASVIPAGRYSKKFKVAIDHFETEAEAHRASAKLKPVIGQVGWVYESKK